jgi:uncharacterized protein HemX
MPSAPEPPKKKEPVGPIVGVIIILVLMLVGAVYFFHAQQEVRKREPVPYITGDAASTSTAGASTTVIDVVATGSLQY